MTSNPDNLEDPHQQSLTPRASAAHPIKPKRSIAVILYPCWRPIFVISCVIAVSVDPLFFYLPVIDEKKKCIGMDKTLKVVALVLRSLTDITLIVNIIYQFCKAIKAAMKSRDEEKKKKDAQTSGKSVWEWNEIVLFAKALAQKLSWRSIVIDFFAVLPIPQVLGAFWYFFSIQRETSCWHRACVKHSTTRCNYYCDDDTASRNMTFINSLDEFCLVDVPGNATAPFDFGIFLDSLKTGNAGSIDFRKKFLYSFWWGLRNLSNFGTNLETSTYIWENCFAILISIIGLLLFLYLIGKVQTFISMRTQKSEERDKKLKMKKLGIQVWMKKHDFTDGMKLKMKEYVKRNWEDIKDADTENLFSILPVKTRKVLKEHICMKMLQNVPLTLKTMEKKSKQEREIIKEKVLKSICNFLKPVMYPDNCFVFRMGEPLDRMLLITEGLVWAYNGDAGTGAKCLGKGRVYGDDQLLSWASNSHESLDNVPLAKANVKCHGKAEGFVLMAKDLKVVVDKYKIFWPFRDSQVREEVARQVIQTAVRHFKPNKISTKGPATGDCSST
ncbi:hypothetical protein ABKV19_007700 [Rosa sericea]